MLKVLNQLFEQARGTGSDTTDTDPERALQVATALLLVEVSRADYQEHSSEEQAILDLLQQHLGLSLDESTTLVAEARDESDHSASLQAFTRTLHEGLSPDEKLQIVEMLWRVALADDHLDKHEDHLVRKICGLLYISHSDVIRLRNKIQELKIRKLSAD